MGVRLTVIGCSPAWPNPGSAHSGYLVEDGDARLLLDCGPGVLGRLRASGALAVDAIAITHFHLDHWGDPQAFFWSPQAGLVDLPIPPGMIESRALDINDAGQITGWIDFEDDGMFDVGFLANGGDMAIIYPPAGSFIQPQAINNDGHVVGTTSDNTQYYKGFIWHDGVMTLIEPTFGPRSAAYDINREGQIVGWMGTGVGVDSHAFIWHNGNLVDLGTVPDGFTATAHGISDNGYIVGSGHIVKNTVRGFLWEKGRMLRLEPLAGFDSSEALEVNSHRQVVGDCFNFSGRDGFIWQHGVMTNLNDLHDDPSTHIGITRGINDLGQITGYGSRIGQGPVAFVLTPIPRIHDLDGDCVIGAFDLEILVESWGTCAQCASDLDGDGAVGIVDLLMLLANWG